MRRRDLLAYAVIALLGLWCAALYQKADKLDRELSEWEESRFEMTRMLADLQKRLFILMETAGLSRAASLPESSEILKLNLLERRQFPAAYLKYAGRLKLLTLSMQSQPNPEASPTGAGGQAFAETQYPDVWPTDGTITSLFGLRKHPILKTLRFHSGVDIANFKNTEILAAAGGMVKFSGPDGGYGNAVIIDHGNGFESLYGHAEDLLVKTGESVKKGHLIASMGSTGMSTGEHLHFEVRFAGEAIDPTVFVK